jgi:5'-nucleotidase
MTRPLVLCSNDDGIEAPYLTALATLIEDFADVLVVAPERQRSAASHAITLHKPLRLTEIKPRRYALSGTPVDCVYLGILKLCDRPPAVVVSGVNEGYNLGSDVFYSGTVAAAVEGALRGAAGIACSLAPRAKDPDRAIRFAAAVVRAAVSEPIPAGTVLNVNMPETATDGSTRTMSTSGAIRAAGRTTGSAADRRATTTSRALTASPSRGAGTASRRCTSI